MAGRARRVFLAAIRDCDPERLVRRVSTHIHTGPTGNNLLDLHVLLSR